MRTDKEWDQRYLDAQIPWDIGYPSPPLCEYLDQLKDKDSSILIPGCGNAYEAEYAWLSGFENLTLLDFAETSKQGFLERVPDFPADQFVVGDFFSHEGSYDLILEQTFFCALDPVMRGDYVKKMAELLSENGKLVGVLFDDPLNDDHPPYGGNALEYLGHFQPVFESVYIKQCYNSIEPRMGRELFIMMGT